MSISHRLLIRLIRLEQQQHQQQLSEIKQRLANLEKQNNLIETLDRLAGAALLSSGHLSAGQRSANQPPDSTQAPCMALQLSNDSVFRRQLFTSLQQCMAARSQQMTTIRSMADIARIRQQRLQRLRNLVPSKEAVRE